MSMNTKSSPSRYRYCISRLSTLATSTLTPALKVLSTTLPDSTFFSLVRTKAGPLPGLTCWNSTTFQSCPSMFSVMPFFRSFVVATGRLQLQNQQFPGGRSQDAGSPVRRHDQDVLDPDAALAGQVHTRLDGDWNPVRKFTRSAVPQHRRLVDLQAHAVPEAVLEMLRVPGGADHVPRRRVHVPDVRPDRQRLDSRLLCGGDQVVDVALPPGRLADRDGARHVRVVAPVLRPEVDGHQVPAAHRAVGRGVMGNGPIRPARDDRLERRTLRAKLGHAVIEESSEGTFGNSGADLGQDVSDGL